LNAEAARPKLSLKPNVPPERLRMEKKLDTCIASMVAAIDEQGNKFYLMISPNADVYPK
jgi:hypothetical protein